MSSITDLALFADLVTQLIDGTAPWWLYLIIAFIPFSILIAVREAYCWFNKINSVTSKLDRIDKRLKEVAAALNNLALSISQQNENTKKVEVNSFPDHTNTSMSVNEEKFYLDKDWTKK